MYISTREINAVMDIFFLFYSGYFIKSESASGANSSFRGQPRFFLGGEVGMPVGIKMLGYPLTGTRNIRFCVNWWKMYLLSLNQHKCN